MTPYWPIVAEPAEPSFGIRTDGPEHTVHLFVPRAEVRTPTADARPGAPGGLLSRIVAFLVEGFALCAAGMYPELFCGTEAPPRPSPDELADDAPRSWRSDVDAELQAIVAMHRTRR
ncbi:MULTISPECIES: hypothetical protein [unclassified Inquilinus]|uniref:hypothetical protein n=1 Tax=unclassified Inquilinus TaxID=2645927 RepID=UPI003F902C3F